MLRDSYKQSLIPKVLVAAKQDIVLEYMYPRLDIEVSKHLNHLLKSPFCVHPGTGMLLTPLVFKISNFTGRICVPIDSSDPASFDPFSVPTVTALLSEIDSWEKTKDSAPQDRVADWEKTSLKDYIQFFKRHVDWIMADERIIKKDADVEMGGRAASANHLEF